MAKAVSVASVADAVSMPVAFLCFNGFAVSRYAVSGFLALLFEWLRRFSLRRFSLRRLKV